MRVLALESGRAHESASNVELVQGDVRDPDSVERAVDSVDTVFHLASDFRQLTLDEDRSYAVNVLGTVNVLKASRRAGVERFVHCSTIGVHGSLDAVPGDETSPVAPCDNAYERHKALAEDKVREMAGPDSVPATIVRPGGIYGPGDLRLLKLFRLLARNRFVMIGDGSALIDMVYMSDVVHGLILAATRAPAVGECFIISGGEYVEVAELVRLISDKLGTKGVRARVPLGPVLAVARVAEALSRPLGIAPPISVRRLGFFTGNRAFSIARARDLLGYEPRVSLAKGLDRTIRWYRENGHLPG